MTLLREIIHSCSNRHVAYAALSSIGGDFARRVVARATVSSLAPGLFVAATVKEFSRRAEDHEWDDLEDAMRGADQPLLSGLQHILDRSLSPEWSHVSPEQCPKQPRGDGPFRALA
jgi:hypothetical protein